MVRPSASPSVSCWFLLGGGVEGGGICFNHFLFLLRARICQKGRRSGPAGLWRKVLVPGRRGTGGSAAQNHEVQVCSRRAAVLLAFGPGGSGGVLSFIKHSGSCYNLPKLCGNQRLDRSAQSAQLIDSICKNILYYIIVIYSLYICTYMQAVAVRRARMFLRGSPEKQARCFHGFFFALLTVFVIKSL